MSGDTQFAASDVRWVEWRRYSSRQRRLLPMGGLMGSLSLSLRGIEPFWPFLSLGPPRGCMPAKERQWGWARCGLFHFDGRWTHCRKLATSADRPVTCDLCASEVSG
jgi:hypothetical protein